MPSTPASCPADSENHYGGVDINRNYPTCFEFQTDDYASSGEICRSVSSAWLAMGVGDSERVRETSSSRLQSCDCKTLSLVSCIDRIS